MKELIFLSLSSILQFKDRVLNYFNIEITFLNPLNKIFTLPAERYNGFFPLLTARAYLGLKERNEERHMELPTASW